MNSITKQDLSTIIFLHVIILGLAVVAVFTGAGVMSALLIAGLGIGSFIFNYGITTDKINVTPFIGMVAWAVAALVSFILLTTHSKLDNRVPTSYPVTNDSTKY